jgi:5-methylcytosine-specific restriction endonuclease McrA
VPARATQDIPPSVRRVVWRRDHGKCVVPGCRSTRFLDLHHIVYRSEGGDHSPDNLCLTCFAHHDAEHEGRLVIRGRVSTGLTFTHADGRPYGEQS